MRLAVHIKIGRRQGPISWNGKELTIGIDAPPIKGEANNKLVDILSDWLNIRKNQIYIINGHTSRHKLLEVDIPPQVFSELVEKLPKFPTQTSLLD